MQGIQSEDQNNIARTEQQIKEIDNLLSDDKTIAEKVMGVNVDVAWKKLVLRKRNNIIRLSLQKWLPYAAAVIFIFLTGYYLASHRLAWEDSDSFVVFEIPNSEKGNVTLPDGTQVELNSMSKLKYPDHFLKSREVFLNGEAFFDVKADPQNPFLVHVDDFTIKVTGTKFNVKSYSGDNPETTLQEGKISVINDQGNELVELKPNESLSYDRNKKRMFITTLDTNEKMGWRQGRFFFKNQTIEEMVKIVERWYNVKIEFEDDSIKNVRLTGTILKYKPIDQLLTVLEKSEPLDFVFNTGYDPNGRNIIKIRYKK